MRAGLEIGHPPVDYGQDKWLSYAARYGFCRVVELSVESAAATLPARSPGQENCSRLQVLLLMAFS